MTRHIPFALLLLISTAAFSQDRTNARSMVISQYGIVDLADGSKGAWFKDTEGNLIALAQAVPATTRAH